jgi:hypothetical protein
MPVSTVISAAAILRDLYPDGRLSALAYEGRVAYYASLSTSSPFASFVFQLDGPPAEPATYAELPLPRTAYARLLEDLAA